MDQLKPIETLIENFNKLPSIGKKSAERLAYAILEMSDEDVNDFINALKDVKEDIHTCKVCGMYSLEETCPICLDENRNHNIIMVVSYPKDVIAFEKSNSYNGVYHILNGSLSANKNIELDELNVNSLINRVKDNPNVEEVILATNPTIDGETTALYIFKKLKDLNVKVTRLAYGLSIGASLDYADPLTLTKSLQGRIKIGE